MSLRLFWLAVSLLFLSSLATGARQSDLDHLTQQLAASGTKAKSSARFILNRGIGQGTQNESTTKLAQELGFTDADGNTDPAILNVPLKGNSDWLGTVAKLHQEGRTKSARAIDAGSPVDIIQEAVQKSRAKFGTDHAAFQTYLKENRVSSAPLGLKSLDDAKLPAADAKGPIQYFAKRFFLDKAYEDLRKQSDAVHKMKPWLGVGGPYGGYFDENVEARLLYAWRTRALTSPWVAEQSWQNGDFSPQGLGYYLALARNAEPQNDILCDLHVGTGNYADGVRRSFYLGIAMGARGIRFVGAVPPALANGGESLPAEQISLWKTFRDLGQEAAKFESVVIAAKPRKADVGIVVSLTQELWDNSTWVSEERKALYQAARLGGHNVTILTDEDIQEGKGTKLSSIYYVGHNIQRETAKMLRAWVMAGGSFASVGGCFRDEYDQPIQEMLDFLGVEKYEWIPGAKAGPAKITLAQLKPKEEVDWGTKPKRFFPIVYGKLNFTPIKDDPSKPPDPVVNARFKDGSVACVTMVHTAIAHAWLYTTPIGSGWLKTVLPPRPWQIGSSPTSYNHRLLIRDLDGDAGDMVMGATGEARWDVITDNLAVETILMEGPKGYACVCINWSNMKPQKAFLTAQYLPQDLTQALSLENGPLKAQRIRVTLSFHEKVNVTDMILIEPGPPKTGGP